MIVVTSMEYVGIFVFIPKIKHLTISQRANDEPPHDLTMNDAEWGQLHQTGLILFAGFSVIICRSGVPFAMLIATWIR